LDGRQPQPTVPESRAHQRLLREFLEQHLTDGRELRAFSAWELGVYGQV